MNILDLQKNLGIIKAELEREVDRNDISAVQDKLMKLTALMGLAAECMKEASALRDKAQLEIIKAEQKMGHALQASILKMKIDGALWEEESLNIYADRLFASVSQGTKNLQTVISLYKTDMQISSMA